MPNLPFILNLRLLTVIKFVHRIHEKPLKFVLKYFAEKREQKKRGELHDITILRAIFHKK